MFIGRWRSVDAREPHEIAIRPSADTFVVQSRIYPTGHTSEG
jgi:hypothetical protein